MPTAWELLQKDHGAEFEGALELAADMHSVVAEGTAFRTLGIDPLIQGILGVHVVRLEKRLAPAVLIALPTPILRVLGPEGLEMGRPSDRVDEALNSARTWIADHTFHGTDTFAVVGLPPPKPQIAPGESIHCGNGLGSIGARISTAGGGRAVTTAGHVAPTANSPAFDVQANLIGNVASTAHLQSVGPGVETADFAVVELEDQVADTASAGPDPLGVAGASIWDDVTAYGAVTSGASSILLSVGAPFAGTSPLGGNWGAALLTAYAISAPGDSGAQVLNASNELVGHVVAGYPGVYSVLQDATYQFSAFGVKLR